MTRIVEMIDENTMDWINTMSVVASGISVEHVINTTFIRVGKV